MFFILIPTYSLANSAEPPAVVIVVNNAPADLVIEAKSGDVRIPATVKKNAWETYYVIYYYSPDKSMPIALQISVGAESYTVNIGTLEKRYDNIYTLNAATRTLTEGTLPFRSAALVALRVALTLLIEGALFYTFGFRKKSSWLAFFIINLITQGLLNLALSAGGLLSSYRILVLIVLEVIVLLVEIPAFIFAVREHKKGRRALFALAANILSFIAGGFMITLLPV
jgi:hypothetical protein